MSRAYESLKKSLKEAIEIEKGELELKKHSRSDVLPAPTYVSFKDKDKKEKIAYGWENNKLTNCKPKS